MICDPKWLKRRDEPSCVLLCRAPQCDWSIRGEDTYGSSVERLVEHVVAEHTHRYAAEMLVSRWLEPPPRIDLATPPKPPYRVGSLTHRVYAAISDAPRGSLDRREIERQARKGGRTYGRNSVVVALAALVRSGVVERAGVARWRVVRDEAGRS